ncbi:Hypothetical protein FKW44_010930 [Caligus rogercresseyi]|uniref:Uncharacterized protein n=1 Tax=Caligus rogercresseyi TaxID=217165 RepID=A0A7T8HHB1_CALRO|nr:Hypothetical protein FKW44_010930 [Caligus rogercresseyi]
MNGTRTHLILSPEKLKIIAPQGRTLGAFPAPNLFERVRDPLGRTHLSSIKNEKEKGW